MCVGGGISRDGQCFVLEQKVVYLSILQDSALTVNMNTSTPIMNYKCTCTCTCMYTICVHVFERKSTTTLLSCE